MKKRVLECVRGALNKLALIAFVSANVIPASADVSSYYTPPAYGGTMLAPAMAYQDPSLIFQNQAALNIYNSGGSSLGQLPPGAVFQTQMMHDPLAYVLSQPTMNYPAFFGTAAQMPTAMGPMVPASLEQSAMLANGTTLPMNTDFYIPPAEFSYEKIRAIGARASDDDELNKMIADSIFGDDRDNDDDDSEPSSSRTHTYSRYSNLRPNEVARESSRNYQNAVSGLYSTRSNAYQVARARVESRPAFDLQANGPFKIVGPTCDCRSRGMACVITGTFGTHRKANKKTHAHNHAGIDVGGGRGTPIVAAADGRVTIAYRSDTYGNTLDIEHAGRYMTRYAHMTKFTVTPGQYVRAGDIIGYMGNTGSVAGKTGVHLHFETCKLQSGETRCHAGNVVNPLPYMSSNGSINQNNQLNKSCSAVGSSQATTAPAYNSSSSSRAKRSVR